VDALRRAGKDRTRLVRVIADGDHRVECRSRSPAGPQSPRAEPGSAWCRRSPPGRARTPCAGAAPRPSGCARNCRCRESARGAVRAGQRTTLRSSLPHSLTIAEYRVRSLRGAPARRPFVLTTRTGRCA
jgi:hypothetical protein